MGSVTVQDDSLKQLVMQEIDQQLQTLPNEITQSIDRESATLEILKLLSPILMQGSWKDSLAHTKLNQILNLIIADATSLSLIRLVCHTAIATPAIQSQPCTHEQLLVN